MCLLPGFKLLRLIPASYSDGVYQVATDLPNPREISNALTGQSGSSSTGNLTVMAVYFGEIIKNMLSVIIIS